jgi:hypothetical protein
VEIRCGECGALVPADATQCPSCQRALGSAPTKAAPGRPLLRWAMIVAAIEVVITLVVLRACLRD